MNFSPWHAAELTEERKDETARDAADREEKNAAFCLLYLCFTCALSLLYLRYMQERDAADRMEKNAVLSQQY